MIAGNIANVVLEVWLVYGLDLGIKGSAWGTVAAQTAMGIAMAATILRRVGRANAGLRPVLARRLLSLGKFIFIRTASLIASFFLAGVVVARLGDAPLAAYQIAFQLWVFLALVLDSIAIAGQIIVGQELGATRPDEAFAASVRMIWLSVGTGAVFSLALLALGGVIPRAFTSDPAVLAQCALLWPIFALMQPLNGAVFALDGILIGASDGRYLALSMATAFGVFAGALAVAARADWGVRGVWAALTRADRDAPPPDGGSLPAAPLARDGVRLTARAGRSQFAVTATSANPDRRMLRYEFEGRSSRSSPVSVMTTSQPAARAWRMRAASNALCPPLPRCSGRVAAKPRYPTPSAI